MKNFLKTFRVIIPAGEEASALAATGDNLAVYETNAPFIVRDDSGSLYEIDRACRVESLDKDGFGRLTLLRPPGVTGDIVVKLAVGSGVRLFDGRLQYTSQTKVDAEFAVTAIPPQVRSRFLPRYVASAPLLGDAVYSPDLGLGPKVTGAAVAGMNLLAPADTSVVRRVIRLTSGASAKIGRAPSKMGVAGQFFELTAANPEITLDGSESTFGLAAADADLTVFETLQTTRPTSPPGSYKVSDLLPDPADRPADIPRSLNATVTASVSAVVLNWAWNVEQSGLLFGTTSQGGSLVATGIARTGTSDVKPANTGAFTVALSNVPETACAVGYLANDTDKTGIKANTAYVFLSLSQKVEWYNSMSSKRWKSVSLGFSTGQTFYLAAEDNYGGGPSSYQTMNKFRIAIPFDGSAPYVEQCHKLNAGDTVAWKRQSEAVNGVRWWTQGFGE